MSKQSKKSVTAKNLDQDTPQIIPSKGKADPKCVAQINTLSRSSISVNQTVDRSPQALEVAIEVALQRSEEGRRICAIWDLRAGVLFQLYRQSLTVAGRKYAGFWDRAEKRFSIHRATISRKMRLAAIWAKQQGADEATVMQLAQAADLTDESNRAVQLALDFIGDKTTTDLYREHKLVNYGPEGGWRETKADGSPRNKKRTKAQIERDTFEGGAPIKCRHTIRVINLLLGLHGPQKEPAWAMLDDGDLETLKTAAYDLYHGVLEYETHRKAANRGRKG